MTDTDLLAAYRPAPGGWDEMVDVTGRLRDPWAGVAPVVDRLGGPELARRRAEAARLLDDDGVTYTVVGDGHAEPHRWNLDPLPSVLSSDEWTVIEDGIIQRAELLDLVLADLYGPRTLLAKGLLPASVVLGHPGFLRACDGVKLPGPHQLFQSGADLVRDPTGTLWVLADRTQAPSGAGYALENRNITSRVFPSLYRDAQVHRLAPFFRTLRVGLQNLAPAASSDPSVVVLTPGALAETAYEHAFVAATLGYPLVEGSDLVVREGRVWMRALGRLDPVDVILRRVDAWFCDPLELRGDSALGVPGLVEASRLGTVSIANTLGSGVLENPGLQSFLPALSQHLLGEPLRLPTVPSWWCGDPAGLETVLARLDHLVIKPIARGPGKSSISGWLLSSAELDDLRRRISARPERWVGLERVHVGSVPTMVGETLESRPAVLRTFVVARGDSYAAMPGGLTRVAPSADSVVVSNQAGALAKDTWVLASEPEQLTGFWLQTGPDAATAEPNPAMSARAAEHLFWMGRYAERADAAVRLLRSVHDRRNEFAHLSTPAGTACLDALLVSLTHVTTTYPGFVGDPSLIDDPGPELDALVTDASRAGTVAFSVRRLVDAARTVRDQLSRDTWLVLGGLERDLLRSRSRAPGRETLGRITQNLLALAGLASESMVRDEGWHFLDAGMRLERGLQLIALLRSAVTVERDMATDSLLLESVLGATESIITYRRRYRSRARVDTVLDLLLTDTDNPRSLAYQLEALARDVAALPGPSERAGKLGEPARRVLEATTALRLADTAVLATPDGSGVRPALDALLSQLQLLLAETSEALGYVHFTHLKPQRSLGLVPPLAPALPRSA